MHAGNTFYIIKKNIGSASCIMAFMNIVNCTKIFLYTKLNVYLNYTEEL